MQLNKVKFILLTTLIYLLTQIIIIARHIYHVFPVELYEDPSCLAFTFALTFEKSFFWSGMSEENWLLGATAFALLLSVNIVFIFAVFLIEHKVFYKKAQVLSLFLSSLWIITFIVLWMVFIMFLFDKCVID